MSWKQSKMSRHFMSRLIRMLHPLCALFVLVSQTVAENLSNGNGPLEPLLANQAYPTGLTEKELETLSLDDPKLRIAYYFLIKTAIGGPKMVRHGMPEMFAALNDLKRRGATATPLLLDLMAKNQNTRVEDILPQIISGIGGVPMEPYVEYLRQMIKSRSEEINATAFEVAVKTFLKYGTPEDVKACQKLAVKRPFLTSTLKRAFESHARSLTKVETAPSPDTAPLPQPQAGMEPKVSPSDLPSC